MDALELENYKLRQEIQRLKRFLYADFVPPLEWKLHAREIQILQMLLAHEIVPAERMHYLMYGDTGRKATYETHVSKLRKKVKHLGIVISSERNLGYWLEDRQLVWRLADETRLLRTE